MTNVEIGSEIRKGSHWGHASNSSHVDQLNVKENVEDKRNCYLTFQESSELC